MIRSYTPDDESAMLSLWNTAGAVMGYAPVPLEDFHRLLTRHPNFSPAYTFVLEEKGTLLGFVNGCTGAGIPKGDIRGYLSCLILAAEADSDENTALLLSALENASGRRERPIALSHFSILSACHGFSPAHRGTSTTTPPAWRRIFRCMTGCCPWATGKVPGNAPCTGIWQIMKPRHGWRKRPRRWAGRATT